MVFLVSYDLKGPVKNYEGLFQHIQKIANDWCRPCESTWVINTNYPDSKFVYDALRPYLNSGDYLIVIGVTSDYSVITASKAAARLEKLLIKPLYPKH
jgi:hypothetical protein